MAVVNTHLGFVFLANPHTASRATETALMQLEHSLLVGHHHADLTLVKREYPNACTCKTVFETVRHPLDWLVSRYCCRGGRVIDWEPFLMMREKKRIFGRFSGQTNAFIKYETLKADLESITGQDIDLDYDPDHKSPNKPADYMSYWTAELVEWAKKRYPIDFERFGYE